MYASISFPSPESALILLSTRSRRKFVIEKTNFIFEDIERNKYNVKLYILNRTFFDDNDEKWNIDGIINIASHNLYLNLHNVIGSSHFHLYDSHCSSFTSSSDNIFLNIIIGSVNEHLKINAQINSNQLKSRYSAIFHQIELRKSLKCLANWVILLNNRYIENAKDSNEFPKYVALGNVEDILFVSQSRMNFSSIEVNQISYNGKN